MAYLNRRKRKKWYITLIKLVGGLLAVLLIFVVFVLSYFTAVEYNPPQKEGVTVYNNQEIKVNLNQEYTALTFNIGYGSLGIDEDFVMDGGKQGVPSSIDVVKGYLRGIKNVLTDHPSDIYFLQEVDLNSRRSFYIDERHDIAKTLGDSYGNSFAYNYNAKFVPFPFSFTDYMGKVESGILSFISFGSRNAERHQFPGAFAWPVRTVNLKRGMLVNYLPIEGSDKLLVAINIHLSAYDSGELRDNEMKYLKDFLIAEKNKGNYVIVGGDFNQTFPQIAESVVKENENKWFNPIQIKDDFLPEGYQFAVDPKVWTSRLLNQPYEPADVENTYYFIIDGFIVSSNIEVIEVTGLNLGFVHSDHNPVSIKFKLKVE